MSHDKETVRAILDAVKLAGRESLTAPEGKRVCDAYGISVPQEGVANSAAESEKLAIAMGFPVVMKIVSPDILHKTEAGGVVVGIPKAQEASKAYQTIIENAKKYMILGYWHTIVTPPMVFAKIMVEARDEMRAKGIDKPIVASLAGDVEVEEAAQYLYEHGIPAYAYSTEIPVAVLGAKYQWARGAGLI